MAKQDWSIGREVNLGGRRYLVLDHLPPKEPGTAGRRVLTPVNDRSRVYQYTPFRGLVLVSGDLIRPRRRRVRKVRAKVAAQAVKPVTNVGLWARLAYRLGLRKSPSNKTITRAPGQAITGMGATHAKG